jgi:hypothetical protein
MKALGCEHQFWALRLVHRCLIVAAGAAAVSVLVSGLTLRSVGLLQCATGASRSPPPCMRLEQGTLYLGRLVVARVGLGYVSCGADYLYAGAASMGCLLV